MSPRSSHLLLVVAAGFGLLSSASAATAQNWVATGTPGTEVPGTQTPGAQAPRAASPDETSPEDAPQGTEAPLASEPFAELRALDKVTARVTTLWAPVGQVVRFGTLEITPAVCYERPPEEPPESAAFLTIVDVRPGKPATDVFSGWMFASSPGLSAMEHPVYDVWVLDCPSSAPSDAANSSVGGSR